MRYEDRRAWGLATLPGVRAQSEARQSQRVHHMKDRISSILVRRKQDQAEADLLKRVIQEEQHMIKAKCTTTTHDGVVANTTMPPGEQDARRKLAVVEARLGDSTELDKQLRKLYRLYRRPYPGRSPEFVAKMCDPPTLLSRSSSTGSRV